MELTSSHLCFTTRSPTIAVITCFWPDHLELHGSLERYRAAKEAIVRHQGPDDVVVANEDDADAAAIASLSPGRRFGFSATREVEAGAFVRGRRDRCCAMRQASGRSAPAALDAPRLQALLAAAATALAAGALPETLRAPDAPPFRAARVGRLGDTELIDDGMAATPAKTASALHESPRRTRSSSSPAASSRAPGCRCTPRREEQALLEERLRRGASRRAPRRPLRPRRRAARAAASTAARRSARRRLDEAIAPRIGPRRGRQGARRLADVPAPARGSGADRPGARGACAKPGIPADPPPVTCCNNYSVRK